MLHPSELIDYRSENASNKSKLQPGPGKKSPTLAVWSKQENYKSYSDFLERTPSSSIYWQDVAI